MIKTIIAAIITYLVTSIDEIPVLFMLYAKASNKGKAKTITIAYFAGTFLLIALGLLGSFGLLQIPKKWIVGLVGLIPLILGVKVLFKGDDDEEKTLASAQKSKTLWVQVLTITLALGADDLGVYIPLFTTLTVSEVIWMIFIFTLGVAVLCLISYRLIHIDKLTRFIEKQERFVVGIVFVAIGILVIVENGTFSGIVGLFF